MSIEMALMYENSIRPNQNTAQLDEVQIRDRVSNARDAGLPGVRASDVEPKRLHWLWPDRLPLGMFCGLEGDPGEGKSLICADITARITIGTDFPDGAPAKPGNVLIISGEDDEAVTLRPRLEAAGADLSRVVLWTKDLPVLPKDLPKLLDTIKADRMRLAILDPVDCFFGDKIDPNSNPSVRRVLGPLARAASQLNCTILAVRHLNKDMKLTKAIYRGSGSIGIAGQARAVFLAGPTKEDPEVRVFARVKGNLAKCPPALGYHIIEATIQAFDGSEIKTQKIDWIGKVKLSADDLVREQDSLRRGPEPEQLGAAMELLGRFLADGKEHLSKELYELAASAGISHPTMMNARRELGVRARSKGFKPKQWVLWLPRNSDSTGGDGEKPNSYSGFAKSQSFEQDGEPVPMGNSDSTSYLRNPDSSTNHLRENYFADLNDRRVRVSNPPDPGDE
jgi:hypothetical protein